MPPQQVFVIESQSVNWLALRPHQPLPVAPGTWVGFMEPTTGFEPVTPSLPRKCSTPEPRGLETPVDSPTATAGTGPGGQNRLILQPPPSAVNPSPLVRPPP